MILVDVIVPTNKDFDYWTCYYSDLFNIPDNFFLVDDIAKCGNANVKRNWGAAQGHNPYLFFCDDDVVLIPTCLEEMYKKAEATGADVVYCDFMCINHPLHGNYIHKANRPINTLTKGNFISTMSLIRRNSFPGWDEKIERLQDWDLWLTMYKQGRKFEYIPKPLFAAIYSPTGITQKDGYLEAEKIIRKKHNL